MKELTLRDLALMSSLDLAKLVLEQQELLKECNQVIEDTIKTLEEIKNASYTD